jgi:cell division protein FtsB
MGSIKSVLVGITFLCGACAGPQEPESVADSTQQVTQAISAQAPIPDPPGLIKRGDTRALLQKNQAHRARIEALKQQIEGLVDGSSKDALLQELEQESAGYRASREGLIDSPDPTIAPPSGPKELSAAQLASLREKMVGLDMQKPADAAKWAKIKHEELGR